MKSKSPACVRKAVLLCTFAIMTTSVAAQVSTVPSKLSGRWTTLDGAYSQSISANIDAAASKGTLDVWSNSSSCTIRDAPVDVIMVGEKLVLKVAASYTNPCRADVSVELSKKVGSTEYEGELRQGGPAGAQFPVLRVRMSP